MPNPLFGKHRRTGAHFGHQVLHQSQHVTNVAGGKQGIGHVIDASKSVACGPGIGAGANAAQDLITYFPPLHAFTSKLCDIYTNTGTFPPAAGNKRYSSVSFIMAGTFLEGSRQRAATGLAYTHIGLFDPNTEIRDGYAGNSAAQGNGDYLAIPQAQTNNWWFVVFGFVTNIPNLGRRKVVLLDRHGTPGNWGGAGDQGI